MVLQVTKAALIVVDWVTGSQSALSWKPFNRNKLAVSVGRTILLTQLLIGEVNSTWIYMYYCSHCHS